MGDSLTPIIDPSIKILPAEPYAEATSLNVLFARLYEVEKQGRLEAERRLELAQRESEERFRATFEQAAVGIAHVGLDGKWLRVNQRLCDIVGYTQEELLQRTFQDITHPADLEADLNQLRRLLLGEISTYSMEKRYFHKLGHIVWINLTVSLAHTAEGTPDYCISVIQDITSRKQAAEITDYVMASAHCLLWYADIYETDNQYLNWEMRFPDANSAQRFLPLEMEEGEQYKDAWYRQRLPQDRDECDVLGTNSVRAGASYQQEYRSRCKDGSIRWLHEDVQVETVVEGRHWRAVGVCTDISERKLQEAKMEAANRRLKRSIAETHHRVKNNLQVVAALVEMQTDEEGQTPEAQSAFQRMGQHIRSLAAIHDLLTFEAKSDADIDTISARAALEKLIALMRETIGDRRIKTYIENLRLPSRQATSLVVLVNELMSNAIKHSRGEVELTLELREGTARLEICDDGPGFASDFNPLTSANTGLEIVESVGRWDLQGEITYETRPEGGGKVVVEFPIANRSALAVS